jgi:hypothetical protein
MIVVWKVSPMRQAILNLKKEGMTCARTELKHVTSLLTRHICMIPDFIIEFERTRNMTDMIAKPPNASASSARETPHNKN